MPVKIQSATDPTNPMVITQAEYNEGRINFKNHYFLENCNTLFGGQDIVLPWDELNTAVNDFMLNTDTEQPALRFVYCYSTDKLRMYLRLQLCKMEEVAAIAGTYALLMKDSVWYKIDDGQMVATPDHQLYDELYLDQFYYCDASECSNQTVQQLSADETESLYTRNITFPWFQEVVAMYEGNGSPEDAYICFGACSYVNGSDGNAPVEFPHGLVLYLRNSNGEAMLNNENELVIFSNKGCDMGTQCPPTCNVYVTPV